MQRDAKNVRVAGLQVRQLRERQEMTQTELAEQLGKSQSYVSRMEMMQSIDIPLPVLARLARVLRVPLLSLLDGVSLSDVEVLPELADAITILQAARLSPDRQRLIAELIRTMVRESAPV